MKNILAIGFFLGSFLLSFSPVVEADSNLRVRIPSSDLNEVVITFGKKNKELTIHCGDGKPFFIKSATDLETVRVVPIQKNFRKAKKAGNTKKARRLRTQRNAGNTACRLFEEEKEAAPSPMIPGEEGGEEEEECGSGSSLGNFCSNGDVTGDGKECFDIPSQVTANLNSGELVVESMCAGCHGPSLTSIPGANPNGWKFFDWIERVSMSPMFIHFDLESSADLQNAADITAYLNRFNISECP